MVNDGNPYREPAAETPAPKPIPMDERILHDASYEELLFWEKTFLACAATGEPGARATARGWATHAVIARRVVFPQFASEKKR